MKAFSSVGGGVKGVPTKLEGGAICLWSFREVCDVDIAVCHVMSWAASRSLMVIVAWSTFQLTQQPCHLSALCNSWASA